MRFDQPPPEPLANALGFLLSWNGQRVAAHFAAALEPLGLRPQHFGVLRLLEAEPGATQNELVGRSMIDPSTMVKVRGKLEELGPPDRRRAPAGRRLRAVNLTTAGREVFARAMKVAAQTA